MFQKVKEYIQTSEKRLSGCELNEYLDELQNSKLFKHSKIHIIDNPSPQINGKSFQVKTLKIDEDFRFSEIEIILDRGTTRLKIWTEPITKWTRFKGKVYLSSISLGNYSTWNGDPPSRKEFYISGNFDRCKISHDMETAIKLDRLYELDKLDV